MPEPTWSDRIATVLDACHAARCTDTERECALRLLERWGEPRRALEYIAEQLRQPAVVARTPLAQCPYVGEL